MVYNVYWPYHPYYGVNYGYDTFEGADTTCVYDNPDGWQPGRGSSVLIPPFFSVFFI